MPQRMTAHEAFSSTFDPPIPFAAATTQNFNPRESGVPYDMKTYTYSDPVYGFGVTSARLQNTMYGSNTSYGFGNNAVILLEQPAPVEVGEMSSAAPSRRLSADAASYMQVPGQAYGYTASRAAAPAPDGTQQHWLQPKDVQPPTHIGDKVKMMTMPPPRGVLDSNALLTPAERREALVYQKCQERAHKELRAASHEACRLTLLMQRRHPNGVLGVESAACPDSLVYAQKRQERASAHEAKSRHSEGREARLKDCRETYLSYPMLSHDSHGTYQNKLFQHKARAEHEHDGSTQHYGLTPSNPLRTAFRSNQELPGTAPSQTRTQQLVDSLSGGRNYDIISGKRVDFPPSKTRASDVISDRRAHPSNIILPRSAGASPALFGPPVAEHQDKWMASVPQKCASQVFLS